MKRLHTIAGILMRDMQRSFTQEQIESYTEQFSLYTKVLSQKRGDTHKIYSLHEPYIYAMAKGKDHKSYEFGVKASIATTYTHGIVVGAVAHETNEHDSKTLKAVLAHASTHRHTPIEKATCDGEYRGVKEVNTTHICIPEIHLKRDTKEEKEQKRKQFRRRAAVEPTIGHLKHNHKMARNYLKGFIGDQINLLMAACAWNLKKWMNIFIHALFLAKDYRQVMVSTQYIKLYWNLWLWLWLTQRESRL